jgi:N-acetylglucosamine kinase-like BadF-type ATPase
MSLLLADSGSTKTEWRFLEDDGRQLSFFTEGFNPYHRTEEEIEAGIKALVLPLLEGNVPDRIHFYGSGCTPERKGIIESSLETVFGKKEIFVASDLLGAARGLCGKEAGIAAILGTGSNSCSYDGDKILENRPALGYVLGDEGSGAAMGRELVRLFLYGELEEQLRLNFEKRFSLDKAKILDAVYRQPMANRFLASFGKFIFQNISHPQCSELVIQNLRGFIKHHILHYPQVNGWPLHVTGSIGFYFSNLLRRVAEEQGVRLGRITETPMAGLVNYYSGEE